MANERQSHAERLERLAARELAARLGAAGWQLERDPQLERRPDLLFSKGSDQLVVEVKAMPGSPRRALLPGLLADAILRARRIAVDLNAMPLAIVAAKSLSDSMVEELAQYVDDYANGAAWGVVDERGRFAIKGKGLGSIEASRPRRGASRGVVQASRKSASAQGVFSDLGQWMLKVLLAEDVPVAWLSAPRGEARGVSEFAELAGVSISSASKFLACLEQPGFLNRSANGMQVVERERLLRYWASAAMQRAVGELPARFALPAAAPLERLKSELRRHRERRLSEGAGDSARPRACLALFAACDALGVGIVRGAPIHLYVEDFDLELIEALGLVMADDARDADVVLCNPEFPESVFRGAVEVDGVPVSDVFQCRNDVWRHPARGQEQAEEIRRRLIDCGVLK